MYFCILKRLLVHPMNGNLSKVSQSICRTLGDAAVNKRATGLSARRLRYFNKMLDVNKLNSKHDNWVMKNYIKTENVDHDEQSENRGTDTVTAETSEEPGKTSPEIQKTESFNEFFLILQKIKELGYMETNESQQLLNTLDERCCELLPILTVNEILLILNQMANRVPEKVTSTNFYQKALDNLIRLLPNALTARQMVNLLFLSDFGDNQGSEETIRILDYLPHFENLTKVEQMIVSETMYNLNKNRSAASSKMHRIENTILNSIDELLKNEDQFNTVIAAVARKGASKKFSLLLVRKNILEHEEKYSLRTASSILRMCAHTQDKDDELLERLVDDAISDMMKNKSEYTKYDPIDTKDTIVQVDGLLWAISLLNYQLSERHSREFISFILSRLTDFRTYSGYFCTTLLSLWMLGVRSQQLVKYCFRHKVFRRASEDLKLQSKMDLLMTCIKIEAPKITIPNDLLSNKDHSIKPTPITERLAIILENVAGDLDLSNIRIEFIIDHLAIGGISADHENLGLVHINVRTKGTYLRTGEPNGYLNLKIRLSKALGYHSILVDYSDVDHPDLLIEKMSNEINCLQESI